MSRLLNVCTAVGEADRLDAGVLGDFTVILQGPARERALARQWAAEARPSGGHACRVRVLSASQECARGRSSERLVPRAVERQMRTVGRCACQCEIKIV